MKKVRIRIFARFRKILTASLVLARTKTGRVGLHTPHLALPMSRLHYTTKNLTQKHTPTRKKDNTKKSGMLYCRLVNFIVESQNASFPHWRFQG